jgi:hypothetical protein
MLRTDDARSLALPDDDLVLPFRTVKSDVVGRVIRLGQVVDTILSRHAYPEPVSHALGQALALTAMLGTALKSESKLILQTKTDGALDFLVADFVAPGKLRGYASFDKADARLAETKGRGDQGALLGKGHVAMTIDPGNDKNRYQGVVRSSTAAGGRRPPISGNPSSCRPSPAAAPLRSRRRGRRLDWRAGGLMPAVAARRRPAAGRQRGRRRGELEPRAPLGCNRGGPRASRPHAGARAPALPAVPRGGRARDARHHARRRMPLLA